MVSHDQKEKADELKMLNTFTKPQLIKEVILLRRDNKRQHTMLKNHTNYNNNNKKHDNNI